MSSIKGLSVFLRNTTGSSFVIGEISIPSGDSIQIWDTVNYHNVTYNFAQVLGDLATLNQAIYQGDLVMSVNLLDLSSDDAFAQWYDLESAYQSNTSDSFAVLRMEGESAIGLSDVLLADGSTPITGNLQMDGYNILNPNLVDGVKISNHHSRHQNNGDDAIDGYQVGLIYTPSNYPIPTNSIIGEHLANIDKQLEQYSSIISGPVSSTDNAVALFDGITGKFVKNSSATIDGYGNVTAGTYNNVSVTAHHARHEISGEDQIDGYHVAFLYTPINYTSPIDNVIGEHIARIDEKLTNWQNVAAALGEQSGNHVGYVFQSDGYGSGSMGPNIQKITHRITVGKSGDDINYTSVATAVTAATVGGAAIGNYWEIIIYPGTYIEPPFTINDGIIITTDNATAVKPVLLIAANPNTDFITMTGGCIKGLTVVGVTDQSSCCVRCATADSICSVELFTARSCYNGIIVSNGARLISNILSIVVAAPGMGATNWITCTGSGSLVEINSCYCNVVSDVLPAYSGTNPIQKALYATDGGVITIANGTFNIPDNDGYSSVVYADSGAYVTLLGSSIKNSNYALHIGPAGSNTIIDAQCIHNNNVFNVNIESSTGIVYCDFSVDTRRINMTTGAKQIGLVKYRNENLLRLLGAFYYNFTQTNTDANIGDFIYDGSSTGLCDGGTVSAATGLNVDVAAGEGWIRRDNPNYKDTYTVEWSAATVSLIPSATNYVYYNSVTSLLETEDSQPSNTGILLATVVTDGYSIRFLHQTRTLRMDPFSSINNYLLHTRQQISISGLATIQGSTNRHLTIGSGSYYLGIDIVNYIGSGNDGYWSSFYGINGIFEITNQNLIDIINYDNNGTLTAMSDGYYRGDYLVLTSDGRLSLIYDNVQYPSLVLAEIGATPTIPTFILPSHMPLARIFVQKDIGIVDIIDSRPTRSSSGGASGGVSVHSALAGLDSDDHKQYLLVSGSRAMTGDMNMGTHNITNIGTIDGVDVSAHASRHNPGGSDSLSIGTPVAVLVGATAAAGTGSSYALNDHQHGISTNTPVAIGTANSAGTASSVARSDHVHDHGSQTSGTLHAVATQSISGFLSSIDKIKLDGVSTNAASLTSTASPNVDASAAVVGIDGYSARKDHTHQVNVGNPTGLIVGGSNIAGTSNSLVRADHIHALPAFGTTVGTFCDGYDSRLYNARTPVNHATSHLPNGTDAITTANVSDIGTANSAGSANSFARSDHVHNTPFSAVSNALSGANASISVNSHKITNLATPTVSTDAVNKNYVDGYFGSTIIAAGAGLNKIGNTLSAVANADGSITVNSHDIQVGILASDTQHGSRGGGSQHSVATQSTDGFLSSSDKIKIDGIAPGATNTTLASAGNLPVDITKSIASVGTDGYAARADHKHNISTEAPSSLAIGGSNTEGTATSLARSDHIHALPIAGAPIALTVGGINTTGISSNIALSDHKHALPSFGSTIGTFAEGNDSRFSNDRVASGLRTTTTIVSILDSAEPVNGKTLVAYDGYNASWAYLASGTDGCVQFKQNNIFASNGNFIWNSTFGALLIGPTPNIFPGTIASFAGDIDTYTQLNIQNNYTGNNASGDVVITADNGDDESYYVDLGMNSSSYNDPTFGIAGVNEAYLYSSSSSLAIGTGSGVVRFFTGGTLTTDIRAIIDGYGIDLPSGHTYRINGIEPYLRGPVSFTNNAVLRFDGTSGNLVKNSAVTISDSGNIYTTGNTVQIGSGGPGFTTVGGTDLTTFTNGLECFRWANSGAILQTGQSSNVIQYILQLAENQSQDAWQIHTSGGNQLSGFTKDGYLNISGTNSPYPNSPLFISKPFNNSYSQVIVQNTSAGTSASSDFIAVADTGNNTINYIDLGINSSTYDDGYYTVQEALDSYLQGYGGNLSIGTGTAAKNIKFNTGGTLAQNLRFTISDNAIIVNSIPIQGIANPSNEQDAATKNYVDGYFSGGAYLSSSTPQTIGTAGSAGTSNIGSRSDHVHTLGFTTVNSVLGTANASISVNSQKITNLLTPSLANDATTKGYVDGYFVNSLSNENPLNIGTVASVGISNLHIRSDHVHALDFSTLNSVLGTASSSVSVNSQKITNLATPTLPNDAVTKAYIDGYNFPTGSVTFSNIQSALSVADSNISVNNQNIINLNNPVSINDAANRNYVDYNGIKTVTAVATSNIDISTGGNGIVIDSIVLVTPGQRVLLTGQTNSIQNGIWITGPSAWTRADDLPNGSSATNIVVLVKNGYTKKGSVWFCNSTVRDGYNTIIGTDDLTFIQIAASSIYQYGGNVVLSNTTPSNGMVIMASSNSAAGWIDIGSNLLPSDLSVNASAGTSVYLSRADHSHTTSFNTINSIINTATLPISVNNQKITNLALPTEANDAVNKSYIDGYVYFQFVVAAAATTNVATLSGLSNMIENVQINQDGMKVLLTAQTSSIQNGIWVAHSGSWTRLDTMYVGKNISGCIVCVTQGISGIGTVWVCRSDPGIVGTNPLSFEIAVSTAKNIQTSSGYVSIGSSSPPSIGQSLIATSETSATWQNFVSSNLPNDVNITANSGTSLVAARSDHVHSITSAAIVNGLSTASSTIYVGNQNIRSVANPSFSSDAANKFYVDGYSSNTLFTFDMANINSIALNLGQNTATWGGLVLAYANSFISNMALLVYTAGSTTAQCGIYNAVTNALIGKTNSVSVTSNGLKTFTFGSKILLTKGTLYYLAATCNDTTARFCGSTTTAATFANTPKPSVIHTGARFPTTLTPAINTSIIWIQAWG